MDFVVAHWWLWLIVVFMEARCFILTDWSSCIADHSLVENLAILSAVVTGLPAATLLLVSCGAIFLRGLSG